MSDPQPENAADKVLDVKKQIGNRLKKARENAKLTQKALAEKAGVSRSAIVHYEKGSVVPGSLELINLARALGVSPNGILTGSDLFFDSEDEQHALATTDNQIRAMRVSLCFNVLDRSVAESVSALVMTLVKEKLPPHEYELFISIMAAMRDAVPKIAADLAPHNTLTTKDFVRTYFGIEINEPKDEQ